jgi:hypothetical protein
MHLKKIAAAVVAATGLSLVLLTQTTPGASAATSAPTSVSAHTVASSQAPSIKWRDCDGAGHSTTSVAIILDEYAGGSLSDWCFSYKGTWKFNTHGGFYIKYFCSGNNYGSFTYLYKDKPHSFNFGPGKKVTYGNLTYPDKLTITGWRGKDSCL